MRGILPPTLSITIGAEVGLGLPEMFALGAAIGNATALRKSLAIWLDGILIPTKGFWVTTSGIPGFFLSKRVTGPGKSLSIICCWKEFSTIARSAIWLFLPIWTIRGLLLGLPFTVKIFCTASLSRAFAPSP